MGIKKSNSQNDNVCQPSLRACEVSQKRRLSVFYIYLSLVACEAIHCIFFWIASQARNDVYYGFL
jgi:hypothetical protein